MDDTSERVGRDPGNVAGRTTEKTRGYAVEERGDVDARLGEPSGDRGNPRRDDGDDRCNQEKLKPRNIVAQATDRVKSAATERVRDMADTASQTAPGDGLRAQ